LQKVLDHAADGLEYRPAGWRATLITDATNGLPQAVQHLPGPTLLPFITSVAILVTFGSVLVQSYITAAIATVFVVGLLCWWLYRDPPFDQNEADLLSAHLKLPMFSSGTRAAGWWGMWGLVLILFTILGGLIYSYYYIRLYSDQWPQLGISKPALTAPAIAYAVLVAGGFMQVFNLWARKSRRRRFLMGGLAVVAILGLAFIAAELWHLLTLPFGPTGSAYGSIFFTLNGFIMLTALTGVFLVGGTLLRMVQLKESLESPRLTLWLQNCEIFWFFTTAAAILAFFSSYVTPYVL
jgi:cytochrome c oxidase subunit I+III